MPSFERAIKLLVHVRDARWMWNLFGPIYNKHILNPLSGLYEYLAGQTDVDGPARILDVGAGRGYVTLLLAGHLPAVSLLGIDFSDTQVRAAEQLRKQRGLHNCRFVQGNAMSIPFANDCFEAVITVGSIKHWPDPQQGVREMYRVLTPGKWAVISETDREVSEEALKRFMRRFTAWYFWDPLLFWGLRHIVFGESYTEREIVAFAQTAGFRQVATDKLEDCPYVIVKAQK